LEQYEVQIKGIEQMMSSLQSGSDNSKELGLMIEKNIDLSKKNNEL
jgi:hypothetical protein